jgi:chromosomal replication initiator protein
MAFAAGQTLFTKKYFNPIFLSGEVGLGKTHLLHAIGNKYLQLFPNKKVKYITSDNFIRQTYNALSNQNDEIEKLKDLYQSYDLLLLDDIQFFSRKEKINEIFFHIFNNNISKNKIIVLSSDKPVNQLEHFEDRMKSRFASGLIINISKPSLESIKNIFNSKLENEEHSFKFSNDALEYIARRHNDDIRKLEGFLNKIIFYAVTNLPPNAIITEEVIKKNIDVEVKEELKSKGFDFDPNILIDQICNVYGVEPKMIKSKIKTKQISQVRHICMYALRQKFNMSYEQIGSLFQKHHTTVIEAITNVEKLLKKDENLKNFIENIYRRL